MSQKQAAKPAAKAPPAPQTGEEVVIALRTYHESTGSWPTLDELVDANPHWLSRVAENRLFNLRGGCPAIVIKDQETDRYS